MGLLSSARSKLQTDGMSGLLGAIPSYLWRLYLSKRHKIETAVYERQREIYNIYEEDWELLIVLDGCRYDLFAEVADEFDFISDCPSKYSPASSSREWLESNFDSRHAEEIAATTYVTGNPFSQDVFDGSEFKTLDEVWRYAWDQSLGTIPPRALTDRAIELARSESTQRCVVHYMQPHFPALSNPEMGGKVDLDQNVWINSVWDQLRHGELEQSVVWNAYRQNLRTVLEEVEILLNNVDAERVVITADHGNGFGENGIYGHPSHRAHNVLREVPWVRTSASDTGTHQPAEYEMEVGQSVREKLSSLGYV